MKTEMSVLLVPTSLVSSLPGQYFSRECRESLFHMFNVLYWPCKAPGAQTLEPIEPDNAQI